LLDCPKEPQAARSTAELRLAEFSDLLQKLVWDVQVGEGKLIENYADDLKVLYLDAVLK
jgi:hypothetical protein